MIEYKNLKLNHQLCFSLYAATHAITRAYKYALQKYGLTYPQYLVMLVLWASDGVSVNTIAKQLNLNSATLTPMLKRLEIAGYVTRERSSHDERVLKIKLTEIGLNLKHQIAKVQQSVECKTGLSEEEFTLLRDSLHKLVKTISEKTEK